MSCLSLFQPSAPLFLQAVMFIAKKEPIEDGVLIDPKSPLGQCRLQGFTSGLFLTFFFFPYILKTLGRSPPHPLLSLWGMLLYLMGFEAPCSH